MATNKSGQIRVYQDHEGVFTTTQKVNSITLKANGKEGKDATVTISVSNDGTNYVEVGSFTVGSSANNTVSFGGGYSYVKIASAGKQLQITAMTLVFGE
jgi:urease beta subunit